MWDARIPQSRAKAESEQKASSPDFIALIDTIRAEGLANRKEESREDHGKRFREYLTLVFIVATTAGVFYQAYIFSGQLAEMKSSGEQTGLLIGANAKLAEATAKQADAAEKQAKAMNEAVEVSKESLIVGGRAWVGPRSAKITSPIEIGKPIEVAIDYANTGREPALDFSYTVDAFLSSEAEEKRGTSFARVSLALNECRSREDLSSGQVVFPSTGFSAYNLTVSPPQQLVTPGMIDGEKTLIVQGCFLYKSFNVVRHSYFCYFYRAQISKAESINICTAGHYAD